MLIFPIQNRPDWSRPPLITLALIGLNLLVFLLYQSGDSHKLELAADVYQNYELGQIEAPYYRDYQRETESPDAIPEFQAQDMVWLALYDRGFDAYLRERWQSESLQVEKPERWRERRLEFESIRNRVSSIAAGLTPAESRPVTFLTSMFLHGGWGHLIGNMVFLFLFGFTLEMALRPWAYLGMYLISGVAADLLFIAINPESWMPLVGASGAISGLMGMYLALYRFRSIRFFYTVFFYFGEFRAPALWIFPLWVAKELYGHFFVDSNTAYWAHIGGLLAGAAMMFAFVRAQREFGEREDAELQRDELTRELAKAQAAMARLDVEQARRTARLLCQRYPDNPEPWTLNFQLYKGKPDSREFHQQAFAFIRQFSRQSQPSDDWLSHADQLLSDYIAIAPKAPALTQKVAVVLARTYRRAGRDKTARIWQERAEKGAAPASQTIGTP